MNDKQFIEIFLNENSITEQENEDLLKESIRALKKISHCDAHNSVNTLLECCIENNNFDD
ncbi:MAG: hypothetical protein MHPSP_002917, partial [Paramarteilia canceri]